MLTYALRAERLLAEQQLLSSSLTAQLEFATRAEVAGAQFTCFTGTKVQILTTCLAEAAARGLMAEGERVRVAEVP
jgi:hypothetical protein